MAHRNRAAWRRLLAGFACAAASLCGAPAQAAPWSLTGALGTHDPHITKSGSTWWIFETTDNNGIGVKYSSDGRAWTQGTPIFGSGLSWWGAYNGNTRMVWAPSCSDQSSVGVCYYAVSSFGSQKSAIGLATSAGGIAAGKWVDQGAVITSQSGSPYNAIDPAIFGSGSHLVFGSFWNGLYVTAINSSTKKPSGSATNIARDTANGIENGHIVKRGSYHYLFASKGACCKGSNSTYYIVVGRSSSINGPYVDKAGTSMMSGGGTVLASSGTRFKGPGGQSLLPDGSVMAWHAYDSQNGGNPVLFIGNVTWGSDGWPQAVW